MPPGVQEDIASRSPERWNTSRQITLIWDKIRNTWWSTFSIQNRKIHSICLCCAAPESISISSRFASTIERTRSDTKLKLVFFVWAYQLPDPMGCSLFGILRNSFFLSLSLSWLVASYVCCSEMVSTSLPIKLSRHQMHSGCLQMFLSSLPITVFVLRCGCFGNLPDMMDLYEHVFPCEPGW